MVFRALFSFEVHIQQRQYLTGETFPGMLLEVILKFQNNKEIHNDCAKMQKYIVAGLLIIC